MTKKPNHEIIKRAKKFAERMQNFEDRLEKLENPKLERKKCYLCEKPPITYIKFKDGQSFVSCVDHDPFRQFPLADSHWKQAYQDNKDLYDWLNGKTNKRPIMADRVFEKLSPDKPEPEPSKGAQAGIVTAHCETCKCNPAPPLHVEVAKALGKEPWQDHNGEWNINTPLPSVNTCSLVPRYDESVELAMGPLEEYCRKRNADLEICIRNIGYSDEYCQINIGRSAHRRVAFKAITICEAIVSHSKEGK